MPSRDKDFDICLGTKVSYIEEYLYMHFTKSEYIFISREARITQAT